MLWKKLMVSLGALVVLAAAYMRPVCTVSVGGVELPGVWTREEVREAEREALGALAELSRSGSELAQMETRTSFWLLPQTADKLELVRALLAATDGVQRAWNVSVDGVDIGRTDDASALSEVVLAYIAERAPAGCISAGLASSLELTEVFVPEGATDDVMELSARLRNLTRVSYTMGDGSVVYA